MSERRESLTERRYECEHAGTEVACAFTRAIRDDVWREALRDLYTLLPPDRIRMIRPSTERLIKRVFRVRR